MLSFVGIVVLPMSLYLYVAHPAWTWMYLVDPDGVPGMALVPLLVLHGGMLLAAWYVGAHLLRSDRQKAVLYALGGGAGLLLIGVLVLWGRLMQYGTYEDYKRRITLDLMDVKLGYVLVALILGLGAAAAYVAYELFRDSRRVRTR